MTSRVVSKIATEGHWERVWDYLIKTRSMFKRKAVNCAKEVKVAFEVPKAKESGICFIGEGVHALGDVVPDEGCRVERSELFVDFRDPALLND